MAVKVSVIVPAYNVEPYIYKCIESILCQTLTDIEVLCINDGSTDFTPNILQYIKKNDSRLTLINNKKNLGVSFSRNHALRIAQGEYIAFVDGDDYLNNFFLSDLYAKAKKFGSDIVKARCMLAYPDGYLKEHWDTQQVEEAIRKKYFIPQFYAHGFWSSIYRHKLLLDNKIAFPSLPNGEDIVFLLKALLAAKRIDYVSTATYFYRQRPTSASYNYSEHNARSVVDHFYAQAVIINEFEVSPNDYVRYYDKKILHPAATYWLNLFLENNYSDEFYAYYSATLSDICRLCKFIDMLPERDFYKNIFSSDHVTALRNLKTQH